MRVPSTPRWSRLSVRHFFRRNSHAQVYRSRPHASDCRRRRRCRLVLGCWSRVGLLRRLLRRLRFNADRRRNCSLGCSARWRSRVSSSVPARAYRVGGPRRHERLGRATVLCPLEFVGTPPNKKEVSPISGRSCACHVLLVGRATRFDLSFGETPMRKYIALALMLLTVVAGSSLVASPALACYGY